MSFFSMDYWMIISLYISCWIISNSTREATMYLV
jgi:hypothetical protein